MTTNYHTAISVGAAANAATFNTPLGALDAAITNAQTGMYNVLEYGAAAGGAAGTNTTSIQAAIDAAASAGGGIVEIPHGTFEVNDALVLGATYDNITIRGAGRNATTLKQTTANKNVITASGTALTAYIDNLVISDMTIEGTGAGTGMGLALSQLGSNGCRLSRLIIKNNGGDGLAMTDVIGAYVESVQALTNGGDGIALTYTSGGGGETYNTFVNCMCYGNDRGFYIQRGIGTSLINPILESNTNEGLYCDTQEFLTVTGGDIEGNGGDQAVKFIGGAYARTGLFDGTTISHSGDYGIYCATNSVTYLTVAGGYLSSATAGIYLESGNNNTALLNVTPGSGVGFTIADGNASALLTLTRIGSSNWGFGALPTIPGVSIGSGLTLFGPGLDLPHTVNKAASATVRNSHDAEATTTAEVLTKVKTITFTYGILGTQRFLFDIKADGTNTATAEVQRNGVKIGATQTSTNAAYETKSQDIYQNWNPGDTCELWLKCDATLATAYVQNFRVAYDDSSTCTVASANS